MQKRSSKKRDINQLAKSIIEEATDEDTSKKTENDGKNPAAVELGRLGGLKGGKVRAAKLTAEQRKAIAKKAAQKRWGHNED